MVVDVLVEVVKWLEWEVVDAVEVVEVVDSVLVSVAVVFVVVAEAETEADVELGTAEEMVVGEGCPVAGPMYCCPSGLITPDGSIRAVS